MFKALFRTTAFAALTWAATVASAVAAEGTLTLTIPAMPTGYPIVASAGLADILVTNVIGEGLTRWKKDGLEVEPALATAWEPNADASVWTFTLREGVNGMTATASAPPRMSSNTFDLIVNKDVRAAAAGQVSTLTSVEIVSPTKVRMTFSQPNASLPRTRVSNASRSKAPPRRTGSEPAGRIHPEANRHRAFQIL